jgi:hypothetical protein
VKSAFEEDLDMQGRNLFAEADGTISEATQKQFDFYLGNLGLARDVYKDKVREGFYQGLVRDVYRDKVREGG